jgi:hypothetical protein
VRLKKSFSKRGLYQALGVVVYCSLVGLIFWRGDKWVGSAGYAGSVMVLILFVVSALICALIVFYKPYNLFFLGKKRQAIDLVLSTTSWLFVILIFFLIWAVLV